MLLGIPLLVTLSFVQYNLPMVWAGTMPASVLTENALVSVSLICALIALLSPPVYFARGAAPPNT